MALAYLASGAVAAVANLVSRAGLSLWLPFEVAVVLAYGVGMFTAFVLMRRFAFAPSQRRLVAQVRGFVLVNLLAVLQTLLVSSLMLRWVLPALGVEEHAQWIAHGVGVVVPVFTSYFGHKHFSFR